MLHSADRAQPGKRKKFDEMYPPVKRTARANAAKKKKAALAAL